MISSIVDLVQIKRQIVDYLTWQVLGDTGLLAHQSASGFGLKP
jgi:hypothetical protein